MARIIGHTHTEVRIELRIGEEDWARFRSEFESEALALRAATRLFEDCVHVALLGQFAEDDDGFRPHAGIDPSRAGRP